MVEGERKRETVCLPFFCECEVDLYVCICVCMCRSAYMSHLHAALSSAVRKSSVTMGTLKCVALQVMWSKISPLLFVLKLLL